MKRFSEFFKKYGVYYSVMLSACIIILISMTVKTQNDAQHIWDNAKAPIAESTPLPTQQAVVSSVQKTPVPTQAPKPVKTTAPAKTPSPTASPQTELTYIFPVSGAVQKEFSGDTLVKSKTMGDWRTHDGMDITAPTGTKVYAAADGTVESVYYDQLYGISILIDHKNGVKTLYQNLSSDEMVTKGQTVSQNTIISGVGDTAICEASEGGHLHFCMIENGVRINPAERCQ